MYAFRCKKCGHLHRAEVAGLNTTPNSCSVCSAGVQAAGLYDKSVWEVLADAKPERLAELGLKPEDVVAHKPDAEKTRQENLARVEAALAQLDEKKANWTANQGAIVKEVHELEDKIAELVALSESQYDNDDSSGFAATMNQISAARSRIADLEGSVWTDRDDAHVDELQKAVKLDGHPPGKGGKTIWRKTRESVFARDKA